VTSKPKDSLDAEEPAGKLGDEAEGFLQVEGNLIVGTIRLSTQCLPTPKDGVDAQKSLGELIPLPYERPRLL
jgi:hypothetical protein